jgi:hypothetical protein
MKLLFITSLVALISSALAQGFPDAEARGYSFDGRFFTGDIRIKNLGFNKAVRAVYQDSNGVWGSSCDANYKYGPFDVNGNNVEVWNFYCDTNGRTPRQFYIEVRVWKDLIFFFLRATPIMRKLLTVISPLHPLL